MIPLLYEKDGINKIGELSNCIECLVEEERNGLFELTIVYPTTDEIFNSLEEENIIICNANDTLKNQKFRIYMTKKLMSNRIEVYARHISFDLAYDRVDSINITNQSCEYSLNAIFKQSQFSTNYRGYSDIINAQNYTIANVNCIEAIAGKEGSIIDTYGTGAEILRDNTNIHVLNRRGNDNEVTIEYAKNLTGFELEEDFSELVTRINASAKYTDTETNKVVIVEAKGIDSPLISNYSHPYISHFDYSDKFEEGEKPTSEKLIALAKKEYSTNNKDKPKQNFKIEFIPLSKCVGYEDLEDKISLCDTVTIIDTRYGINTKAKVIRVVFNVIKDRYESMELGEPRTTLGDIIGTGGNTSDVEDLPTAGPQGPPGQDGTNGVDGVDAIYVNLTNDSHIVPTLSDGTGGNYTGCETIIELYKGADKLNYGVSYEAEQIEGVTASLKGNVYSISNMTVDRCNVGLRATHNGKTYLKYFNVSKSKKGQDGTNGTNGTTYYTWIRYANDSEGNGISDDPTDKEYIGFAYNKITPIESNVPGDYTWSLIKGTDGVPGQNGTDGTTYYTWIKYSDNANGSPCYDVPTNDTKYIGIATNKETPTESNNPGDYKWSKFRGDDGVDGTNGIDGTDGKDAYTINITNDSHIFAAESDGKILKQQYTTTEIVAFKGVDTVPFTIGELPLVPGLGLAKDSTTVSITAFVGYDLEENGSFEIPIIIEGLTFKKVFSWSKAKKGVDGSLGDFPDTLPTVPTLEYELYGFSNIGLNWTFENKMYYQYELYASKTKDFTPNTFDLIHQGQTSSFLFQARPNETWYFKVCGINSHGRRTGFSNQVTVTTKKIDNMSNYFEEAAIGNAVVGSLTADYMTAGIIKGNWIDAKNLTVTDGSGKRTLDIDTFGNVNLDVTTLNINSESVATNKKVDEGLKNTESKSKEYTNSQVKVLNNEISLKVNKNEFNSLIQQNSESVKIAFNGISSEWKFDANKFTNTLNGKTGLSLGNGRLNVNRFTDGKPVGYYGQSFSGSQQYWGNVISGTYNSYYTAIGFNPNVVNDGDSTANGFEHFMTYTYYPFGGAYPNPGIYVQKPMYIQDHVYINATSTFHQNISLSSNNIIRLGSTTNALYQVSSNIYTSSNKEISFIPGVNTYGGLVLNGDGYFYPSKEGGAYSLGTTQRPFYKLYSTATYSNSNIVYNTSVKTKATTNNEDVLDNIEFISSYEKSNDLVMDITKIANTNYVEIDEENNAYMNDSEMIKLLIKEVKILKEEIKNLKAQTVTNNI